MGWKKRLLHRIGQALPARCPDCYGAGGADRYNTSDWLAAPSYVACWTCGGGGLVRRSRVEALRRAKRAELQLMADLVRDIDRTDDPAEREVRREVALEVLRGPERRSPERSGP